MEYLFIYCLQLFELIGFFKSVLLIVLGVSFIIYVICYLDYLSDTEYKKYMKESLCYAKKVLCTLLTIFLLLIFIPSKSTLLMMGGMYLGKKAINTVITDEKIKKIDTIINLELDKRIKDLKEDN